MKVIKKAAPAVLSKGNGCWRKADRADVNSYLVNKVFFILPYEDQFQTNSNQVHFDNDRANLKCLPIQKLLKTETRQKYNVRSTLCCFRAYLNVYTVYLFVLHTLWPNLQLCQHNCYHEKVDWWQYDEYK